MLTKMNCDSDVDYCGSDTSSCFFFVCDSEGGDGGHDLTKRNSKLVDSRNFIDIDSQYPCCVIPMDGGDLESAVGVGNR